MVKGRVLAVIFLWAPLTGTAQGPAVLVSNESTAGLTSVVFQTPSGSIHANFPSDLAAGDTISGTVIDEPAGATAEQKNENSATLSGYVIDTQNRRTTPRERHTLWVIPPAVTAITVLLRGPLGNPVAQASVPVAPPAVPENPTQPVTPDDFELPTVVSVSRPLPIDGRFTGDAGNTAVSFGGQPAEVLAESPRVAVVQVPDGVSGPARMELRERNITVSREMRVLTVKLAANTNLMRGQTTPLTITVGGLAGSSEPVMMTLENRSPGVVSVSSGAIQNFPIPPQEVGPGGSYTTVRTLTGVMRGAFHISAFVREDPLDRFDPRQTVARTLQQWQANTGIRIEPAAQVLIERSVRGARNDLNRLLDEHSTQGEHQKLLTNLVRSYCFQLRDFKRGVLIAPVSPVPRAFLHLPFVNAFQAGALAAAPITRTDVSEHSFASFLQNLVASLTGTQQLSSLEVCSVPEAAGIMIDGKRVGTTIANFVVSAGQHRVVIDVPGMACTLTAKAGQDSFVSCPKRVRCEAPGHDR